MVVGLSEEEVQCPLCLRYHNIKRNNAQTEEESGSKGPSFGEVVCGTTKVMAAAGAGAMLLSTRKISNKLEQAESFSSRFSVTNLMREDGQFSPNFGKLVMATMVVTGVVYSVWSWAYKQKLQRQREEEFRGTLEICKGCWGQIREVLCNGEC